MTISAFPIALDDRAGACFAEPGMTLRDYFAAKALQGICASGPTFTDAAIARDAFLLADAMMAARDA